MDPLCTVWYDCSVASALPEDECSKINDPATGGYENKHMSHLVTDTRDTVLGFMAGITREYESFTIDPSTTNVGAASSVTGRLSILSRAKVFSKCPVITMANVYNVISALELESKLVVERWWAARLIPQRCTCSTSRVAPRHRLRDRLAQDWECLQITRTSS